jgi:hypothetical protein
MTVASAVAVALAGALAVMGGFLPVCRCRTGYMQQSNYVHVCTHIDVSWRTPSKVSP